MHTVCPVAVSALEKEKMEGELVRSGPEDSQRGAVWEGASAQIPERGNGLPRMSHAHLDVPCPWHAHTSSRYLVQDFYRLPYFYCLVPLWGSLVNHHTLTNSRRSTNSDQLTYYLGSWLIVEWTLLPSLGPSNFSRMQGWGPHTLQTGDNLQVLLILVVSTTQNWLSKTIALIL